MKQFLAQVWEGGVRPDMPINLQKQIILSNRIMILVALLTATDCILRLFEGNTLRVLISIPVILLTASVYPINRAGYHIAGRIITAVGYPVALFLFLIAYKLSLKGGIPLIEYIKPAITLSVLVAVPITIFDPVGEKRLMRISVGVSLVLLLLYNPINDWLGIGIARAEPYWPSYTALTSHYIIIVFALTGIVGYVKKVNYIYETRLQFSNELLKKHRNEIQTQHEELLQSQEEVMAQRDFIAAKNKELEEKNSQISSSIYAAEVIQSAILPSTEVLNEVFAEHFVLYKPKDIVSGDFYWIARKHNCLWLVVADCTGHGVPGAFMTILGSNLLDKIINMQNAGSPSEVLRMLNQEVHIALKQDQRGNHYGMDLVVMRFCAHESGGVEMMASGAKNGFFIKYRAKEEVVYIKGDKMSIGGRQSVHTEAPAEHHFLLPQNTVVYIATDGFKDQNDVHRHKFSQLRLQTLMQEGWTGANEEKARFEQALQAFMENTTQRDDILLMGLYV